MHKYTYWIFGNPKNVSGLKNCSLFAIKSIVFMLTNPLNKSLFKWSILLHYNVSFFQTDHILKCAWFYFTYLTHFEQFCQICKPIEFSQLYCS